jgi:hypothetical protein
MATPLIHKTTVHFGNHAMREGAFVKPTLSQQSRATPRPHNKTHLQYQFLYYYPVTPNVELIKFRYAVSSLQTTAFAGGPGEQAITRHRRTMELDIWCGKTMALMMGIN